MLLANHFVGAGWEVTCLRGEGATCHGPDRAHHTGTFSTNDDLRRRLEAMARSGGPEVLFHAAALCDYRVARVTNGAGESVRSPKIATRDGRLCVELEPATKVLPLLRPLFPAARIVGWKYELAGTRDDALGKAWRQLAECGTDACVLNGAAYGDGFALCLPDRSIRHCPDSVALAETLESWLEADGDSAGQGRDEELWPRRDS